jgi:hypothetical protein
LTTSDDGNAVHERNLGRDQSAEINHVPASMILKQTVISCRCVKIFRQSALAAVRARQQTRCHLSTDGYSTTLGTCKANTGHGGILRVHGLLPKFPEVAAPLEVIFVDEGKLNLKADADNRGINVIQFLPIFENDRLAFAMAKTSDIYFDLAIQNVGDEDCVLDEEARLQCAGIASKIGPSI